MYVGKSGDSECSIRDASNASLHGVSSVGAPTAIRETPREPLSFSTLYLEIYQRNGLLSPAADNIGLERRSSSRLPLLRQPSETEERPTNAATSGPTAKLSPAELNERLLRTLEELLPPIWNQLGLSDAFADREQVLRLEDYTVLVRRMSDVVAVFMGEREHESLLLLEFGRRFEQCLRRTLYLETNAASSLFPRSAPTTDTTETSLLPDSSSNSTTGEDELVHGRSSTEAAEQWRLEKALVQRYEELCQVVAEMVSDQGIVNTTDPDVVSRLVWARLEA
ncbi:hypothetical protein F1559_001944 [Cyanidiococcus yangmingshanensis]|uniref:Uncharacterized protein n=1 Tax=Cyanidiococcus yangmingshanensis TaxID=2690220 RepID=A0A7J7IJP7_9RHOD|nr:hypothetical protein F1559_001944 [Cyanidiococcus yangmingshanensis]